MLEKILEEIDERIERYKENPRMEVVDICYGLNMAKNIILKHMNDGWISCEEWLPENERSVLMCSARGGMEVGWWDGKRWRTGFSHADVEKDIIAWRPLPEPYRPEKGAEE